MQLTLVFCDIFVELLLRSAPAVRLETSMSRIRLLRKRFRLIGGVRKLILSLVRSFLACALKIMVAYVNHPDTVSPY
jgi:hypothetical protein